MERSVILDSGPGPGPSLSPREAAVFRLTVEAHVREARPVASQRLVRNYGLPISSATVRSVMFSLTQKGLLDRPHRSAGPRPTARGYRYYVDHLMPREEPSPRVRHLLEERLREEGADRHALLAGLAHVVSVLSRQLGLALVARVGAARITALDFVPLNSLRILAVLGLDDGAVRTLPLTLDRPVSDEVWKKAREVLAEGILGRDLVEARRVLENQVRSRLRRCGEGVEGFAARLPRLLADEPSVDLIVGTPGEIAMQAEFARGERLRDLLRLLEEEGPLVRSLADRPAAKGVQVRIGSELGERGLEDLSTVSVSLASEGGYVVLGILGPMRMDYPRAIALVDWLGQRLREVL